MKPKPLYAVLAYMGNGVYRVHLVHDVAFSREQAEAECREWREFYQKFKGWTEAEVEKYIFVAEIRKEDIEREDPVSPVKRTGREGRIGSASFEYLKKVFYEKAL